MQVIICFIILGIFLAVLIIRYLREQAYRDDIRMEDSLNHAAVMDKVTRRLADLMKDDTFTGKDDIEYQAIYKRRLVIEESMINCVYGIDKAKIVVKELIASILKEIFPTQEDLYKVYPLDSPTIEPWWKFEILMEVLYKTYKKNALAYVIQTYDWDETRIGKGRINKHGIRHDGIEDGTVASYYVSVEDLDYVFTHEVIARLTFREALAVVSTILYSEYKGMGIIDTLRTMNIDGYNIGTSGSVMQTGNNAGALDWKASRSVWVYYHGKYIHFQFLNFGSEAEVRRVVQLTARYNNPGPLTEKRGYLVNTMYDKSRVLALRPQASEYWAVFVRKFVLSSHTLEALVDPIEKNAATGEAILDDKGNKIHKYKNATLAINLIRLLMLGEVTTGVTGRQGSGKTTLMVSAISQVDARYNIRVLEMAPEMYLREIYVRRNILSVAETPTVNAAQLQDALKKSDAALSIVGEVATDVIAARMIQMGQVASIFTIFSHHANRTVDLVHALTNSIVAASGGSATPATVEPQVIDVIHCDVHLDYDVAGNRYIERVTEIVRLDQVPYPDREPGESLEEYKVRLDKEYYTRVTDRRSFITIDVLKFDHRTFTYDVARNKSGYPVFFSPELTKHIFDRIPREQYDYWRKWVNDYWGATDLLRNGGVA